jgi:transcriptional regulator with XRE-family HTH domain
LQRNLTQARLVELIGHGHAKWLSRIENGHQLITLSTLEEIAQILDVPLDALLKASPTPPDPKALGARLRAARQQQGWTQAQAIERLGYSTATWLSGIETGRRQLRPASLEKLARIYHLTVADLLGDAPLPAPAPPDSSAPPDAP